MNRNLTNNIIRPIILVLSLLSTSLCFAFHGGGGGYHEGYYHGGNHYHDRNYYHGRGYYHGHGDYYHRSWGWGSWGPGVVIQVPLGVGGYYNAPCQTVRTCNRYGHCWLQQSCY